MTRTTTGVECAECGLTSGHHEATGHARCGQCGRFAEPTNDYCARHGANLRRLTGYAKCPKCREEEAVRAQEREMMERRADPRMHPTVDAPRF